MDSLHDAFLNGGDVGVSGAADETHAGMTHAGWRAPSSLPALEAAGSTGSAHAGWWSVRLESGALVGSILGWSVVESGGGLLCGVGGHALVDSVLLRLFGVNGSLGA